MQNGAKASIKVISCQTQQQYDQYLVEVSYDASCHYAYLRFSELHRIFGHVTNDIVEFPSRCCFETALKPLMTAARRQKFTKTRLHKLKQYFNQLTQTVDLKLIPQFNNLLELAKSQQLRTPLSATLAPRNLQKEFMFSKITCIYASA